MNSESSSRHSRNSVGAREQRFPAEHSRNPHKSLKVSNNKPHYSQKTCKNASAASTNIGSGSPSSSMTCESSPQTMGWNNISPPLYPKRTRKTFEAQTQSFESCELAKQNGTAKNYSRQQGWLKCSVWRECFSWHSHQDNPLFCGCGNRSSKSPLNLAVFGRFSRILPATFHRKPQRASLKPKQAVVHSKITDAAYCLLK